MRDVRTQLERDIPDRCRALKLEEVLAAVPMSKTTLFALLGSGALRSIKIGKRRFVPVDALAEFLRGGAS